MRRLLLTTGLCPGDICTLTAAVENLHLAYPGEYETGVRTPAMELWQHNPRITPMREEDGCELVPMEYPSIHRSNQTPVPFLCGYTDHLAATLGRPIPWRVRRPCLYLSAAEQAWGPPLSEIIPAGQRRVPLWLVNAGIKSDFTAKSWPIEHYQRVVDETRGLIQWVQVGSRDAGHDHPPLAGAIYAVGRTGHRDLMRLAYHAAGGLGPVTYLQHLCAAFEKPYLCLVGGREPASWVQYPKQVTFHAVGAMPCCREYACWKSRVIPRGDGDEKDRSLCERPVLGLRRPSPQCLAMIRPEEVLMALDRFTRCVA